MSCPECGDRFPAGESFCPGCGVALQTDREKPPSRVKPADWDEDDTLNEYGEREQ